MIKIFYSDNEIIAVTDNDTSEKRVFNLLDQFLDDNGSPAIQYDVVEREINEIPDYLVNRSYYVIEKDGQIAQSFLVDYDEDYSVGLVYKTSKGNNAVIVHASNADEAKRKAWPILKKSDITIKK